MRINLVFWKWRRFLTTRVSGSEMLHLEAGVFHGGATFKGAIELDEEQELELRLSMANGYRPTFWMDVER